MFLRNIHGRIRVMWLRVCGLLSNGQKEGKSKANMIKHELGTWIESIQEPSVLVLQLLSLKVSQSF